MYQFIFFVTCISMSMSFQAQKQEFIWIGKSNRIINPGAESNSSGAPLNWISDFALGAESNWVSEYGVTSHEWNHGARKLGIPAQPGNNYMRLTVNKYDDFRKVNLFQLISLDDIQKTLTLDTVMANFSCWIGVGYPSKTNCAFSEVKVLFLDATGTCLDSIYIKKNPSDFKDLDASTPETEERGFAVMHEMQQSAVQQMVPKECKKAILKVYCEFPCHTFTNEEEEENEGENTNTFFFDNFSLGFIKK